MCPFTPVQIGIAHSSVLHHAFQIRWREQVVTHQPAISFSIAFLSPFNRAGGRTSNVRQRIFPERGRLIFNFAFHMKTYLVHLDDKKSVPVRADTYQEVDGRLLFYRDGKAIPDIYFLEACVVGVSVDSDDDDPLLMEIGPS